MPTISEIMQEVNFDEIIRSYDATFLNECRLYFETTEEFERCAMIRDRIKMIKKANESIKFNGIPK